jgi:tryptophan 2,3-dioxygenase
VALTDELGEPRGAHPLRQRGMGGRALAGRVGEEVAHARQYAPDVATHEDFSEPILEGEGASDYERYLRTDELLALQKTGDEWVHRDELLFQTVHQSSELWLKLAWNDIEAATEHLSDGELPPALRLLRRSTLCLSYATTQLDMLEQMSPWEYQEIRKVLGHGSGFDSPGWREMRRVVPPLGQTFHALREEAGLSLVELYVRGREHEELYQLAEVVTEIDERINLWRIRHYKVVARVIGDSVVGTQGTPVEVLGRLVHHVFFPELWRVRNELTARSQAES